MLQEQIVDFSEGIGLWLLYVLCSIVALSSLRKADLVGGGLRKAGRAILLRILIGAVLATPLVLFLAVWQRTPPHYFIRLRIAEDHITLGFRWPKEDVTVALAHVTKVSYWKRDGFRRSVRRVQIDTSSETYRSYGYSRHSMTDEDYQAIERLRIHIERTEAPPTTNASSPRFP